MLPRYKLIFCFLIMIVMLCTAVHAQYQIKDRSAIPLHGEWHFALDPVGIGEQEKWYRDDYPFQRWDRVNVPHCFSVDPRYRYYTGKVWYRRSLSLNVPQGKKVLLHFDGAYYATTVWLNNEKVGEHEGGYTPFGFDITDKIVAGKNYITVEVDNNTWKRGTIPGAKDEYVETEMTGGQFPGWLNYGGITRPLYLTIEPNTYIENLKIEAVPDLAKGTAEIETRIFLNTSSSSDVVNPSLVVSLKGQKIPVSWKFASPEKIVDNLFVIKARASLKAVALWHVDNPICYQLQAILKNDTTEATFGIRKVEVKNAQLLLNGEPIRVAGGNRVMDYPGLGTLEPDWLVIKDLTLMKNAGMEFHRLTHYTTTEAVLDWADKNGMLIVAEAGNWQLTPKQMDNDTIRRKFRKQFEEMVKRDWNHPSLIAYSVGNEYMSETPSGQRWTKDMIAYAKQLDPTRLYTFASMRLNIIPKNPEDEASQYVDFISANIYGNQAAILDNIHRLYPDKPVLISEYGARADGKNGEQGQVDYLKNYLADIRSRPYVVGASWWSYNDYESRFVGTNRNGYRPWGLVNPDRSARPLYHVHQQEMSPLAVAKKSFTVGSEGNHKLLLEISNRKDFPSYPTKNYLIKIGSHQMILPDLKAGQQIELSVPVKGFDKTVKIEIIKPTGFVISETNIELNYD